jgi:tripartite-type tricarboxylate transporter receptor subunit TctC
MQVGRARCRLEKNQQETHMNSSSDNNLEIRVAGESADLNRRRMMAALGLLGVAGASSVLRPAHAAGQADAFPQKIINYVVPFTPGGLTDVAARMVAKSVGEANKWNIVVENRAGGNANIGAAHVARSAPDGYTWLAITLTHAANVTLFKGKMDYDLQKDLTPLAGLAASSMMIVVNPNSEIKTLADLTRVAKATLLNAGSSGNGTPPHLTLALFQKLTGTKMVHVPYKGGSQSLVDLLGGHLDVIFSNYPESLIYVKSGKLRALAVTTSKRSPDLPDVPTVAEAGMPDLIVENFTGVMGPAHMPPALAQEIGKAILDQINKPAMQKALVNLGFIPQPRGPEAFKKYLAEEIPRWSKIIHDANITAG